MSFPSLAPPCTHLTFLLFLKLMAFFFIVIAYIIYKYVLFIYF